MTDSAMQWYAQLEKPFFAPPAWLFSPVWTVLYILIAVTFGMVFMQIYRGRWPAAMAIPFILNLISNVLFSPIQFILRSNLLALLDVLVVLGSLLWCIQSVWTKNRTIALALIPYLAWVSFATILQASITWLNR